MIDLNQIKPYRGRQDKALEHLCFQICREEYKGIGELIPIDDSGGGDGVEFYIKLDNGDVWGWQCKFFSRLSEGGRKNQIKESLSTAYSKHKSHLKKWVLCTLSDFTPDERTWFKDNLSTSTHKGLLVLPSDHSVDLVHWGDSEIQSFIAKYPYIRSYFFDNRILTKSWFEQKFDEIYNHSSIKTRYDATLHIESDIEENLYYMLGGRMSVLYWENILGDLKVDDFANDISTGIDKAHSLLSREIFSEKPVAAIRLASLLKKQLNKLEHLKCIITQHIDSCQNQTKSQPIDIEYIFDFYVKLKRILDVLRYRIYDENDKIKYPYENLKVAVLDLINTVDEFGDNLWLFIDAARKISNNILFISGNAGQGKTHLAANIYRKQIEIGCPAIFISPKRFKTADPIRTQIIKQLDLPQDYSFDDFLGAFDVMGCQHNTKSLLIIDGLNEALEWKSIFKNDLEAIIRKVQNNYKHIVLVVTYRKSYEEELFSEECLREFIRRNRTVIQGFEVDNLRDAIDKYTKAYNVTFDKNSNYLGDFKNPLFLRIFCELNKGRSATYTRSGIFDVFEQYIDRCNNNIVDTLGLAQRFNTNFLRGKLGIVVKEFWESDCSEVPLSNYLPAVINEQELIAIEGEHILVFRDKSDHNEVLTFTYDLLAGYLIAKHIMSVYNSYESISVLLASEQISKLSNHPLFDDISRCLCCLLLQKYDWSIFSSMTDVKINKYKFAALYEVDHNCYITDIDTIKLDLESLFHIDGKWLLKKAEIVWFNNNHPLNFRLTSSLLVNMQVAERDFLWTEYYAKNQKDENLLTEFEYACINRKKLGGTIHIVALRIMWMLTTPNRHIRDLATRALYYYARRFPIEFLELLTTAFYINDPYVLERILAVTYGVALCVNCSQENNATIKQFILSATGIIFQSLFASDKTYPTTHIVIKEYGLSIINIGLKLDGAIICADDVKLLNLDTRHFCTPVIHPHGEKWAFRHSPMQMDFSNYTIGYLNFDWHSYSNPKEKQYARGMIFSRIYDLGWSIDLFKDIDDTRYYGSNRGERTKVERYGKKYSWIGYYEVAGYLYGTKQISKKEWCEDAVRFIAPDIDPTYLLNTVINQKFINDDFLGDSSLENIEWVDDGDVVEFPQTLNYFHNDFVLVDGYYTNKKNGRDIFAFYRVLLVDDCEYDTILNLLQQQRMGGRWLPEIIENRTCFAGEIIYDSQFTYSNYVKLDLPGNYKVLLPVCKYIYESDTTIGDENRSTLISPEIVNAMRLKYKSQSFDLYNNTMEQVSFNTYSGDDEWVNSERLSYLRKDVFDRYMLTQNKKAIAIVWGERQCLIGNHPVKYIEFQSVCGIDE